MAYFPSRQALVNRSGSNIPVYEKIVRNGAFTGGITAGGERIGTIYPNEFYTIIPDPDSMYITSYEIVFQDPNGNETHGFIETSEGYSPGVHTSYAWADYQEPYHYYNSNGSTLVSSTIETIDDTSYRVFTVNGSARKYYKPTDYKNSVGTLPVGTKLATRESTTGQHLQGCMLFAKKKLPGGSWQNLIAGGTYGFVDLGLSVGSFPSNRPIR